MGLLWQMRVFLTVILLGTLLLGIGGVIGKAELARTADERAWQVINGLKIDGQSVDTIAIELTRQVHSWYVHNRLVENPPLLWRLRPYLTHDYVPGVFRLPEGLIDTLYSEGVCDSAARTLGYILKATGIQSSQLNIVNRFAGGHSVVLARFPDGREAMLDPLYGIVPRLDGELLSPSRAFEASRNADLGGGEAGQRQANCSRTTRRGLQR